MANNNHRRIDPPMSARQGALIIKHLERLNRSTERAERQAKADADRIAKALQRILEVVSRMMVNG